jgi:ABC-type cobalamin/Fe3+-siderophores transport system ATPase subunit
MKPKIILPNRSGTTDTETLECENNIVIIGANGSGKTRLGTWIENFPQQSLTVHRISAQKALNIPDYAVLRNLEQAERDLFFGTSNPNANIGYRLSHKWGSNPATFLLNDYDKLLSTLFAKSAKRDRDYITNAREKGTYELVPDAPIDKIIELWKDVMPQREIYFDDGKVMACKSGQTKYHGKEMSDGERVTLYLIGQCLCVPENSIIVIDEPEIHLHKALMARLWNKVEEVCSPSILLLYITHDLDFAVSRKEAKKIWIKEYDGVNSWVWDDVPDVEEIPENLTLEIIGSRKGIIFCEGEKAGYDFILYQAMFPEHHIVPSGSCEKVIESTKAMRNTPSLNYLDAYGIIDSDYRTEDEINELKESGIYTIDVAEVENLFCIEPLLKIVAVNQGYNPDDKGREVTEFVIECLSKELEVQVTKRVEREIRFELGAYKKVGHSEQGLVDGLEKVVKNIVVNKIYSETKALYEETINKKDYEKVLRLYNRKHLHHRLAPKFGLREGEYINVLLRMLKSEKKKDIVAAIKPYLPQIPTTKDL